MRFPKFTVISGTVTVWFGGVMALLDIVGRWDAAMHIKSVLPTILDSPAISPIILVIGFGILYRTTRKPAIVVAVFDAHGNPYEKPRHPVIKYGLIAIIAAFVTVAVPLAGWKVFGPKPHVQSAPSTPPKSVDAAGNKGSDAGNTNDTQKPPATRKVAKTPRPTIPIAGKPNNGTGTAVGATPMPPRKTESPPPSPSISPPPQNSSVPTPKSAYVEVGDVLGKCSGIDLEWKLTLEGLLRPIRRPPFIPKDKSPEEVLKTAKENFFGQVSVSIFRYGLLWQNLEPQINTAVDHALEYMSRPGPKQLTPHQRDDERKKYADANPSHYGDTQSDLKDGKVNQDKYQPMIKYLTALHEKLADYPENP